MANHPGTSTNTRGEAPMSWSSLFTNQGNNVVDDTLEWIETAEEEGVVEVPNSIIQEGCNIWKRVLERGPVFVAGRIFMIKQWSEELEYQRSLINTIPIWVKFFAVPKQLWTRRGISMITSKIGKPLSWDATTTNRQRLNFERVCVEVSVQCKYPKSLRFKLGGDRIATVGVEYPWTPPTCTENQETENNLSDNVSEDDIREEQDIRAMSTSTELVPYVEPNSCFFDALENPSKQVNSFVEECAVYKDMEPVPAEELNNASKQVFNDHIAKKHTEPPIAITSAPVTRN
ncbi:hypothetical protein IFM89_034701 [Coptis chinensis]|uniref:DUF4283 domain-containing protein n=1 Tax=Coptis chinensis TaxID=261450 RepID=A0A835HD71_9MAGN|nr:hypothetical protein IFM89_034701 [Coptis chinensis]